eukprot:gene7577-15537_t
MSLVIFLDVSDSGLCLTSYTINLIIFHTCQLGEGFDLNDDLPPFLDALVNICMYHSALIASIATCTPIILDCLFYAINRQSRLALEKYIPRREIFFIVILPDTIFILVYLRPFRQFDWLAGVVAVRDTLFNSAFLHYLHNLCPQVWTKLSMLTVAACIMLVNAFEMYSNMDLDDDLEYLFSILTRLFVCIAASILIPLYFKWFKYSSTIQDMALRRKMQFCHADATVYAIFFTVDWSAMLVHNSDQSWASCVLHNYVYICDRRKCDVAVSGEFGHFAIGQDIVRSVDSCEGHDSIHGDTVSGDRSGDKVWGSEDIIPGLLQNYVIDGDKAKLDQVIRNLLSNALKFTPQGKCIHINVDIHDEESVIPSRSRLDSIFRIARLHPLFSRNATDYKKFLRVQVIDKGVGISTEDQQKLFRQEIHFSPGELQNGGGMGIGLLISKGIMDAHKGRIT